MKLIPRSIWLIFAPLGLALLSYGFFHHWMPKVREAEMLDQNTEQLRAEAAKLPQAKKKVENAEKLIKEYEAKWRAVISERTPPKDVSLGGINLNVNAWQLLIDTKRFRNNIQRAVNKQVIAGGVRVINGPSIPGVGDNDPANGVLASYYNYPAVAFPVVIFDLGQVTVQGTYEQILANVRSWARMPRYLAVADGLRLDGTAPILTGTYNLTVVGYIRFDGTYPPVPEGAGGGGGAPAGGGIPSFSPAGGPPSFPGAGGPGGPPPGAGGPGGGRFAGGAGQAR